MTDTTRDLIFALRGGAPENCDFCGQPYTEDRWPEPEEAGEWACSECVARWQAQSEIARLTAERDAALAQVAGAYEAAALFCDETAAEALDESGEASRILNVWFKGQARAIRALTPAAATAALDRIKRQARAEGMREAAKLIPSGWTGEAHVSNMDFGPNVAANARAAILAAADREERGDE